MNDINTKNAIDDIRLIKDVIEKTASSVSNFGRVFLGWGFLFMLLGVLIVIFRPSQFELFQRMPLLGYLFISCPILIIAYIIFRKISKKYPLIGLSKQLFKLWLFVFAMHIFLTTFDSICAIAFDLPQTSGHLIFSMCLFGWAFALMATNVLTNYKLPGFLALIYAFLALILALPTPITADGLLSLAMHKYWFVGLFTVFVWPLTLIILGGYLEFKKTKEI